MVIVVAEGAGQKLINETKESMGKDASGNSILLDVGLWLSQKIKVRLLNIVLHLPSISTLLSIYWTGY